MRVQSEPPRSLSHISVPPPSRDLLPGQRLDRYELLCPIAQGGMASVWVARMQGVHGFQKLVAIKTILAEHAADPRYEAMFLDEARLIANIHHPNVAEILDLGSHDSLLYLVLEWIEGDSLALLERSAARNKRPIPLPVGLRIVARMCAGLNAAHELSDRNGRPLNVVHRDVSPQNVLVSLTGEVKLIDFGIAKALDQRGHDTSAGVLKGKIAFMSPEQAHGQRLDGRADIWSAGVVLYQLLSGELPFRGENQLETLHLIAARRRAPAIPGLPTVLQKLLDRMLEPDRDQRIGSAAELEAELERVAAQFSPVTTRDVAAVVQEHLGRRVASRRATIDTALQAADGRQRLVQVFNDAIEQERTGDASVTEAYVRAVQQSSFDEDLRAPPAPSLALLSGFETTTSPLAVAPERYEADDVMTRVEAVPTRPPSRSPTKSSQAPSYSPTQSPTVRPEPSRAPHPVAALPFVALLAALLGVGLAIFSVFVARNRLAVATATPGLAAPARTLTASTTNPAPSVLPTLAASSHAPPTPVPAIAATDLPLAPPLAGSSAHPHKNIKVVKPAPKRDVWDAFSEHR